MYLRSNMSEGEAAGLEEAGPRARLVALYAALAAHTEPECTSGCERPLTCCKERYCLDAIEFAAAFWDVDLQPTWHRALPLMGAGGCTAAPHLRPVCTAYTCETCQYGEKRGDPAWNERYGALRTAIATIEAELFGEVFV